MKSFLKIHLLEALVAAVIILGAFALLAFYPNQAKEYNIVFIKKTLDPRAFWVTLDMGMEVAAKETGAKITIVGMEREDQVEGQNDFIRKTIAQKPDAIILSAAHYTSQSEICQEITDAGIKLVTVDSDIASDIKTCFVGTNNYNAGKYAGEALRSIVPDNGKIAVMSFVKTSKPGIDREQGFLDALTDKQRENIVGPYYCDSLEPRGYELAKRVLEENPDLDGIVGLNESAFNGIVRALNEVPPEKPLKVAGIDSSILSIQALENGSVNTIIVQNPFNMGYLSVKTTVDALNGKEIASKYIDTGAHVITKENMYEPENQKLLFIFAEGD